jgi:hypothetical protein
VLFFTDDASSLYERDPRGHSLSILLIFLPKELYKKEFLISGPNNNQGKKFHLGVLHKEFPHQKGMGLQFRAYPKP